MKENYRRYTCSGKPRRRRRLRLLVRQDAGRPHLRAGRSRAAAARQEDRPARGLPLEGGLAVHVRDRAQVQRRDEELEAGVRLRRRRQRGDRRARRLLGPGAARAPARRCGGRVFESGRNYVCEHAVPTAEQPTPTCDFKSRKIILQQPVSTRADGASCWRPARPTCSTSSCRCARAAPFKAFLAWDKEAGKVSFEFAPSKFPPRKTRARRPRPGGEGGRDGSSAGERRPPAARRPPAKARRPKTAQGAAQAAGKPGLKPSAELAAVIGAEPVAAHRSHQEAVGLHQGQRPAGRHEQARDQRRRQAAAGVRQAAGDDVRAGQRRRDHLS